jgi:hypothetical protein
MAKYTIHASCGAGEPIWEHRFEMHSDSMALEYTQKLIEHSKIIRAVSRIYLFNVDTDKCIGDWAIFSKTEARNLMRG